VVGGGEPRDKGARLRDEDGGPFGPPPSRFSLFC